MSVAMWRHASAAVKDESASTVTERPSVNCTGSITVLPAHTAYTHTYTHLNGLFSGQSEGGLGGWGLNPPVPIWAPCNSFNTPPPTEYIKCYFMPKSGAPAGFQARVGKIRRKAPKKIFLCPPWFSVCPPCHT